MFDEIRLETIKKSEAFTLERIKAFDGWIVLVNKSACFVPDKKHKWLSTNKISEGNIGIMERLLIRFDNILSSRISNGLKEENYIFVGDLVCSELFLKDGNFDRLKGFRNFGNRSYKEITDALHTLGFVIPIKNDWYWNNRSKMKEDKT